MAVDTDKDIIMLPRIMIRTTVMLPEKIKGQAEQMARESGLSFAEFVRRAMEAELQKRSSSPASVRRSRDPLFFGFDGLLAEAKPGPADGALNHDKHLYEE